MGNDFSSLVFSDAMMIKCANGLFLFALVGNGVVVIVLIASRSKMDVPRFLVCNLAMADFCMGLYLGFLAIVDAATLGEFRKHAISWQFSAGCQVNLHNIPKNQHFFNEFFKHFRRQDFWVF